jgi:hypothetical protein
MFVFVVLQGQEVQAIFSTFAKAKDTFKGIKAEFRTDPDTDNEGLVWVQVQGDPFPRYRIERWVVD